MKSDFSHSFLSEIKRDKLHLIYVAFLFTVGVFIYLFPGLVTAFILGLSGIADPEVIAVSAGFVRNGAIFFMGAMVLSYCVFAVIRVMKRRGVAVSLDDESSNDNALVHDASLRIPGRKDRFGMLDFADNNYFWDFIYLQAHGTEAAPMWDYAFFLKSQLENISYTRKADPASVIRKREESGYFNLLDEKKTAMQHITYSIKLSSGKYNAEERENFVNAVKAVSSVVFAIDPENTVAITFKQLTPVFKEKTWAYPYANLSEWLPILKNHTIYVSVRDPDKLIRALSGIKEGQTSPR